MPRKRTPKRRTKLDIPGAPTLCTPENIKKVCTGVMLGMKYEDAANLAGIHPSTIRNWRRRGKQDPESIYGIFCHEIVKAEANFEAHNLEVIRNAATLPQITRTTKTTVDAKTGEEKTETTVKEAPPLWTPAAWLNERRFPNKYALMTRVETGKPGDFDALDDEGLKDKILDLIPDAQGVFVPDEPEEAT